MPVTWHARDDLIRGVLAELKRTKHVLDIGCGVRPQSFFRPHVHFCVEPFDEYAAVLRALSLRVPEIVVLQGTADQVLSLLPDNVVDSVFLVDVIEHLEKADGEALLAECDRVARQQVILFTPLGFMPQEYEAREVDGWGLHGGDWQTHRSGWTPDEFDASWTILACRAFHTENARGEVMDEPFGAFWAIKNQPPQKSAGLADGITLSVTDHLGAAAHRSDNYLAEYYNMQRLPRFPWLPNVYPDKDTAFHRWLRPLLRIYHWIRNG